MAASNDVRALIIRLSPAPICDACIAKRLALPQPQYANRCTRELAGSGGFARGKDLCSLCTAEKLVIRWSK